MTRRGVLLVAMAMAPLRADEAQEVWDLLTQAASALSSGNSDEFLRVFDRSMPGYQTLAANVAALLSQGDVQSSIEVLSDEGDSSRRSVELDWFLQIISAEPGAGSTERREKVQCRLERRGKRWLITALEPLSFFAPPAAR